MDVSDLLEVKNANAKKKDIANLARQGAQAYLVGESLMRQGDVVGALKELRS